MDLNVITPNDAIAAINAVKADDAPPREIADEGKTTEKAGKVPQVTADDLYSRLLKYIPAPLIGVYLMATNLIIGNADTGKDPSEGLLWGAFLFFALATLAYLIKRNVRRFWQIVISLLAFSAFAVGSPGPFQYIDDWEPEYGTYALIVVAVILIVFRPGPLTKEQQDEQEEEEQQDGV